MRRARIVDETVTKGTYVGEQRLFDVLDGVGAERVGEDAFARCMVVLVDRRHDHGLFEEMAEGGVELGLLRVCSGAVDFL